MAGASGLDGSRSPFDQLSEIVDPAGDKIDVILDGGIRRGTHVLRETKAGDRDGGGRSGGRNPQRLSLAPIRTRSSS